MPIRLERNKVGWKSDHAKGKSEEGKGVGSRFIFLKRRNGREIKGKIVRKIVNYRNKEIVKMHSSAKEELYFSFLFDLSWILIEIPSRFLFFFFFLFYTTRLNAVSKFNEFLYLILQEKKYTREPTMKFAKLELIKLRVASFVMLVPCITASRALYSLKRVWTTSLVGGISKRWAASTSDFIGASVEIRIKSWSKFKDL